jgi:hypothetical protein
MRIIQLPNNVLNFIEYCRERHGLNVRIKNKAHADGLYRVISRFIKMFNSKIDDNYVTVLFGDVWVPGVWFDESGRLEKNELHVIEILIHEMVHEEDRKRMGNLFFSIIYLFPQVLAPLSLFSLLYPFFSWIAWFLLFAVFLLPLPAPGRAWLETRGYRMNIAIAEMFNGNKYSAAFANKIFNRQFKSSSYYWMLPFFKKELIRELTDTNKISCIQKDMLKWYESLLDSKSNTSDT